MSLPSTTILRTAIRVQSALAITLGLIVMAGWKLHILGLLQIRPSLPPMAFNVALWFVLSGAGLASTTVRKYARLTKVLAAIVFGTTVATVAEYALHTSFGIDELFQRADIVNWVAYPGRPSPNTAISFMLVSVALLLHARPLSVVRAVAIGLCGSGAVALASVSLFAHTLALHDGLPWLVGGQAMALHTSFGLLLLAFGLAELSWFVSDAALPPSWVSLSVGLLGVLATIALWQGVIAAERQHVTTVVEQAASSIRDDIERRVTERTNALVRMAHRWEMSGAPREHVWRADAALYRLHAGDYEAIGWCDDKGIPHWVDPKRNDARLKDFDLASDSVRRRAFAEAEQQHLPQLTPILDLTGGALGFLTIVPIFHEDHSEGAIVAIFRIDQFITHLLSASNGVTVELFDDGRRVFDRPVAETDASRAFTSAPVPVRGGTQWTVRITPGAVLFERERSFVPTAVLAAGVTVSMLLATVGLLLDSSLRRAVWLRAAHRELGEQAHALEAMRDQALAATRAKSTFLAAMSHEIRTPMNSLFGMSDLLWETELTAEQREYVRIFRDNSDRLLGLVNDILDLSKVEAGHVELESALLAPSHIVSSTVALMEPVARKKGLTLTTHVAPNVPPWLVGDPSRLKQVVVNLVGNAIKFTERGGVTVFVTLEAPVDESSAFLRFSIADTGPGIPLAQLEQIFEPFVQADSSITRRHGGTGLGLTISRRLAELMGGSLSVESTLGAGSTFWFTARLGRAPADAMLPAPDAPWLDPSASNVTTNANARVAAAAAGSSEVEREHDAPIVVTPVSKGGSPLRVLLADDSPDNVLLVRMYVRDHPIVIDTAENGQIAIDRFQAEPYDLVLMDGQMPIVDGLTATRRMREWERQQGLARTPIVALTAHALREEAQHSLDAGCDAHLTKPIRRNVLLKAIADYARPRPAAASAAPSTAPSPAPPVVKEPAKDVDEELMAELAELVPQFLENRVQDVDKLSKAVDARDFDAIRVIGHNMKGLGTTYGFPRMSEIGATIEQAAKSQDAGVARTQVEALATYLSDVKTKMAKADPMESVDANVKTV